MDLGAMINGGSTVGVPGTRRPSPPPFLPFYRVSTLHVLLGGLPARGGKSFSSHVRAQVLEQQLARESKWMR